MPTSLASFIELSRCARAAGLANALGNESHEKSTAAMALAFRYLQKAFADGSVRGVEFRVFVHLHDTCSQVLGAASAQDVAGLSLGEEASQSVWDFLGAFSASADLEVAGYQGPLTLTSDLEGLAAGEAHETHEPQRVAPILLGEVLDSAGVTDLSATQATHLLEPGPMEGTVLANRGWEVDAVMALAFGVSARDAAEPSVSTELSTQSFRQDVHDATARGPVDNTLDESERGGQQVGTLDLAVLPLDDHGVQSLLCKDPVVILPFLEAGLALDPTLQSTPGPQGDFLMVEPSVVPPLLDAGRDEVDVARNVGVDEANHIAFLAALQDLLAQGLTANEATLGALGDSAVADAEVPELGMIGFLSVAAALRDSRPNPQRDPAPRPVQRTNAPARRRPRVARHARVQRRARDRA